MMLYKAVDLNELRLIYATGMRSFPVPLAETTSLGFMTVVSTEAEEIARMKASSDTQAGYVINFNVDDKYLSGFKIKETNECDLSKLEIPAHERANFNCHVSSRIVVRKAFFGLDFSGLIPSKFGLRGKNAVKQFIALAGVLDFSRMDFHLEVIFSNEAVFLHFPFWGQFDFSEYRIDFTARNRVLDHIAGEWSRAFPEIALPLENHP